MPAQTKQTVVHFSAPFSLNGLDGIRPAGDYTIEEDEDEIRGTTWVAHRRLATFIHLPATISARRPRETMPIDYLDLLAALAHDQARD